MSQFIAEIHFEAPEREDEDEWTLWKVLYAIQKAGRPGAWLSYCIHDPNQEGGS